MSNATFLIRPFCSGVQEFFSNGIYFQKALGAGEKVSVKAGAEYGKNRGYTKRRNEIHMPLVTNMF
jgi:hypothetical protein